MFEYMLAYYDCILFGREGVLIDYDKYFLNTDKKNHQIFYKQSYYGNRKGKRQNFHNPFPLNRTDRKAPQYSPQFRAKLVYQNIVQLLDTPL